jgi:hypothetical protein
LYPLPDNREKRRGGTTTSDNTTTKHRHVPRHEKENMMALLKHYGLSCLGTRWLHTHCPNDADATHSLVCNEHAPKIFLNKKLKGKRENNPYDPGNYKILMWKYKNTPEFCLKAYEKSKKNPWSTTLNFVDLKSKSIFLLYKKIEKD